MGMFMNNYIIHLALREIQHNKKRYMYLSVGIVLSLFLISSILTVVNNFYLNEIERQKKSTGDYHYSFVNTDYKNVELLLKNEKVDQGSISCVHFQMDLSFKQLHKIKADLVSFDNNAFRAMSSITVKQGRMPEAPNEVIIEEWVSRRAGEAIHIGESIDTVINGKAARYKVVGYYNNFNTSQYTGKVNFYTLLDIKQIKDFSDTGIINIYFKLKQGISLQSNLSEFRDLAGKDHFEANAPLINVVESQKKEFKLFDLIFSIPVIVVSIIIIFNSLNISIQERIKYFGLLRSIGASRRHIALNVISEVIFIYLLAAPIGILLSVLFSKILLPVLNLGDIIGSDIKISLNIYAKAIIITVATAVISSLIPAAYAARLSPIGAAYSGGTSKKKKGKNALMSKINSVEMVLAKIDIKRNKKRYIITLLSVTISVILFVVFCSLNTITAALLKVAGEDLKLTATIYKGETSPTAAFEKMYQQLSNSNEIERVYKRYENILADTYIPNDRVDRKYQEYSKKAEADIPEKNHVEMRTSLEVYDTVRLENSCIENYLIKGGFNLDKMLAEDEVLVIQKNIVANELNGKSYFAGNTANLKLGDKIKFNPDRNKEHMAELRVAGILSSSPFIAMDVYNEAARKGIKDYSPELQIIISDRLMNRLLAGKSGATGNNGLDLIGYDIVANGKVNKNTCMEKVWGIASGISGIKLIEMQDTLEKRQKVFREIQLVMLILVLFTSLVGFLNLFNTCKANILARKREFSMMKAIGASEKQITKIVNLEGFIYGIKGSLYGVMLSTAFTYFVYCILQEINYFRWKMPVWIPLVSILASLIAGYVSTIIPLRRVNQENIIEAIKIEGY